MQYPVEMEKISKKKILIVSHKEQQCGVYQLGHNVAEALGKSKKYSFVYAECSGEKEFKSIVTKIKPVAIIYNYYPSTMSWLTKKVILKINVPHIDIIHEVSQDVADTRDDSLFDYHIAPDATLLLKNPLVFKTGRLVPEYENRYALPEVPTIGSFGFGTAGKGFERLISTIQSEFDEAIIRLHIPFATFGDVDGSSARAISQRCKEIIVKSKISITISHDFLDQKQLLDFLGQNSMNAFFYEQNNGRGISSVIDFALAVQRPIAITKSAMFRHLYSASPSICIEDSSLKEIMHNGFQPLTKYRREWSEANLIWDYERIIGNILSIKRKSAIGEMQQRLGGFFKKVESRKSEDSWMPTIGRGVIEQQLNKDERFLPISAPNVSSFNRILDNNARKQYKPVIDNLFELLPEMMARKIPEANIQQAFVLDTVLKYATKISNPEILCIGSYDDTAAGALKKYGYMMDEVDPVLNYDLNTFMHKPSTVKSSYDIIFSTSVLEHVKDDGLFVSQIAELLASGGIAVLTCDYNDQHKPGDPIPQEDFRMYTQNDFKERLLPLLKGCSLVDAPRWDCPNPDFEYAGCRYTFASFVFKKN
jgi:SAM-dependent methyltransferase